MVTDVAVMPLVAIFEITGCGAVPVVVKVKFAEVLEILLELAETTSKSYSVPEVKPVMTTEWLVTGLVLNGEIDPYSVVAP